MIVNQTLQYARLSVMQQLQEKVNTGCDTGSEVSCTKRDCMNLNISKSSANAKSARTLARTHALLLTKIPLAPYYLMSKAATTHLYLLNLKRKLLSTVGIPAQAKPRLSSAAGFSTRLPLPGATPGFSGLPMPLEVRGREDTIDMCLTAGILLQNQWFWKRRKTASISTPLVSGSSKAAHVPINTHMPARQSTHVLSTCMYPCVSTFHTRRYQQIQYTSVSADTIHVCTIGYKKTNISGFNVAYELSRRSEHYQPWQSEISNNSTLHMHLQEVWQKEWQKA